MSEGITMLTSSASRVLLPVLGFKQAQALLTLAEALLQGEAEKVILAGLVGVPEDQPLSVGAYRARRRRQDLARLVASRPDLALEADPHVRVSHGMLDDLTALLNEHACDTLLVHLADKGEHLFGLPIDAALAALNCRVVMLRGRRLPAACRRLLVASRGGEHARHMMRIATALGNLLGTETTMVHAADQGYPLLRAIRSRLRGDALVTREINLRGSVDDLIVRLDRELHEHQVLVLGTEAKQSGEGALGPRTRAILSAIRLPAVVVHTPAERAAMGAPPPPYKMSVEKWFAENTFDAEEFCDIARLVELKAAQGLTISLGLPALNEEATVGNVIATVRDALMDRFPLLDEIVLIDSGSTDSTVSIAASLGVPVYRSAEILPEMGDFRGKGEVLWKSLHVLRGDIIAWIDTDIVNIHPRFVYGIIGPLLTHPGIKYVKGFYRRPLRVGDKLQAGGGGRVTELVVRPLFNLFLPELSGLVQPLAGEYAGRREVFECVPFFSGYAVESGLLIDILERFGLFSIAQVDLKERVHHNQSLRALSKMSFVILQAIMSRLERNEALQILTEPSRSMKLVSDMEGRLALYIEELEDHERPPMITVPAYRARHNKARRAGLRPVRSSEGQKPDAVTPGSPGGRCR
ncbi:MAG: hypothetical protein Kow00120_24170 [Anaerolineae bacterium]